MKNVKPMVGQVWKENQTGNDYEIDIHPEGWINGQGKTFGFGGYSEYAFFQEFTFIPQNDLEWLAVNLDKWYFAGDYVYKQNGMPMQCSEVAKGFRNVHTRQQWQNMRYELGLDDRPKHSQGGPVKLTVQNLSKDDVELYQRDDGVLGIKITQKETKMIDLSPFKIGEDLIIRDGDKVRVMFLSSYQMITEDDDASGCLNMHKLDGTCIDRDATGSFCSCSDIVSRHEPRHWLKDLPDADLFVAEWMACNSSGKWVSYTGEPTKGDDHYFAGAEMSNCGISISGIKMPALTGDEWKLSKISIDELRDWQAMNK